METRLVKEYMLYVDGKPTAASESLEQAKQMAGQYMINRLPLRVESMVAPAPSRIWNYDYDISEWVERL